MEDHLVVNGEHQEYPAEMEEGDGLVFSLPELFHLHPEWDGVLLAPGTGTAFAFPLQRQARRC